ncbi:glucose-6-phosphate dehydrogenase [Psychrobium sp. 1_MG-2023]|uniref:glucose-6-phosphate dehydrogenase n=1 Tax=Psychrobium sp. 1_MG-2023 TaxID=3062624 RepID=UPI000C33F7EF|nr:glucose-6-phosphate dehydrogenase [Psychrobium sp. 1_MG-2023]MDP2561162.1 glucose-6-phosphate dehydrogenase [Psychrobium sp. 1_MG-2023]PKF55136.1 glucose-6-phosphate dehydrogenase [Alteromonadales bacterium alter-6D02]
MTTDKKTHPTDIVLFGCQGDLTRRKLLSSLYQLEKANLLDADSRVIGVAREQFSPQEYQSQVQASLAEFINEELDQDAVERFVSKVSYIDMNLTDVESYAKLKQVIADSSNPLINYFAVPASIYGSICQGLASAGLNHEQSRVVLEKPIGHDLLSSNEVNDQVAEYFNEHQTYRIDHYLGKETVLNLLDLRFANSLFSSKWDNSTVDHVQISVAEEVGIEGRWGYFDQAGQMRDMLQNHLIQILTLVAMDPPLSLDADNIRDEKVKVLKALKPINVENVFENSVRGQYANGFLQGKEVPGYLEEEGANTQSNTETFVALKAEIDNWRWAGVPFYLRTGKRMANKVSEIVVYFKNPAHNLFKEHYRELPPNKLTIRLQPQEGVEIQMLNKVPGLEATQRLQTTKLDLSFNQAFENERIADAYERLLLEVIRGNQALFVRRDEVEASWSWCDGILSAWQSTGQPLTTYPAGSSGPVASVGLIARDGRAWDE